MPKALPAVSDKDAANAYELRQAAMQDEANRRQPPAAPSDITSQVKPPASR
ncbi:hypothetical protein [Streptomyces sp. AcH 505]|uniref:hypothetical protein n=1 Tax=Streptomyces sp. AcH 505 TaxID=352211 RepID=UPI000A83A430